jgi:hypothetical protein
VIGLAVATTRTQFESIIVDLLTLYGMLMLLHFIAHGQEFIGRVIFPKRSLNYSGEFRARLLTKV